MRAFNCWLGHLFTLDSTGDIYRYCVRCGQRQKRVESVTPKWTNTHTTKP